MDSKTQGNPWALQEPLACLITHIQTLTTMDKGVVEDYYHDTNEWKCQVHETNIVKKKISKPQGPFCTCILTLKILIAFFNVHIIEN